MEALRPPRDDLTPTEFRVLQAYSYGLDEEGAAVVLGLSDTQVHNARTKLRRKLRAKNMAQAVANAMRLGLLR